MIPAKKTGLQPGGKNTDIKETDNTADNAIQPGDGEILEDILPKNTIAIPNQPAPLQAAAAPKRSLYDIALTSQVYIPPSQSFILSSSSSNQMATSPAAPSLIKDKSVTLVPMRDPLSIESHTSRNSSAQTVRDLRRVTEKISTLSKAQDADTPNTLQELSVQIRQGAIINRYLSPKDIGEIFDSLPSLKKYCEIWDIVLLLSPSIAVLENYTISAERISNLFNCLTSLTVYRTKWELTLMLLPHLQTHLKNPRYQFHPGNIVSAFQGLKAVAYCSENNLPDIEKLISTLIEYIERQQINFDAKKIAFIMYSLNGIPNPENAAITRLLDYIAEQIVRPEVTSSEEFKAQSIAYILYGLEGKTVTPSITTILTTISTLIKIPKHFLPVNNTLIAIKGLRTLSSNNQAQTLFLSLLQNTAFDPTASKTSWSRMEIIMALYSFAPYVTLYDQHADIF